MSHSFCSVSYGLSLFAKVFAQHAQIQELSSGGPGPTFFRGGSNCFRGGGGGGGGGGSFCLISIETHVTCDFPGGGGVWTPCPSLLIRPCNIRLAWNMDTLTLCMMGKFFFVSSDYISKFSLRSTIRVSVSLDTDQEQHSGSKLFG